jgi:TonB family protein
MILFLLSLASAQEPPQVPDPPSEEPKQSTTPSPKETNVPQQPVEPDQDTEEPQEEPPPLVKAPELTEYVQAPYPQQALEEKREGAVLLLIEIDEAGDVSYVEVLNSAGSDFDQAAVEATWNFVFSPAEDENGPTPVQIEFEYGFVLDAQEKEGAVEDKEIAEEQKEEIVLPINLAGQLLEMGTRKPLAEFPVQITLSDGTTQETETDDEGNYSFRGVPIGTVVIKSQYPEYIPTEKTIDILEDQRTDLRLWLKNRNYREDELVGLYRKPSADISRRTLSVEEIRRIPGTFGDAVRVIQTLPGAARSPLGSGLLVIRGSNPEDSAVYVDGIRIPIIYHLGGYVSVINSDLIEAVDYLPGSYNVRYGRSLGGVVDVKTKTDIPEQNRLSWNTDILDSGVSFTGKLGDYGVALAARRSYIDLFIPYFTQDTGFTIKPRWYDYQAKLWKKTKTETFSVFVFGFEDILNASTPGDVAQGSDPDAQGDLGSTYRSHRAYLLWKKQISDRWSILLQPSIGVDDVIFDTGGGFKIDQRQPIVELRAESTWNLGDAISVTAGADFIIGEYDFTVDLPFSFDYAANYDPLAEREPLQLLGKGLGTGPDLYLNAEIHPLSDKNRWVLYPGIRVTFVDLVDYAQNRSLVSSYDVDPRLSTRFSLTPTSTLKGGVGIYTQPPQPFEMWRREGTTELEFERAFSAEIGWEHQFSEAIQSDISFFGKRLSNLIVDNPDAQSSSDLFFINEGIGRVYGMEMIIRKAPIDRWFGWISYTLSRSERNNYPTRTIEDDVDSTPGSPSTGSWYIYDIDQTHILVAVAGYTFPDDFGISGKVQFVTGNPYTPYEQGIYDIDQDSYFAFPSGAYNSERLPSFFSVDLRADKLFTFEQWQLETYIDLLNIIRGKNPEFTVYNYDYTEESYISGLPFIPSIGFEAEVFF